MRSAAAAALLALLLAVAAQSAWAQAIRNYTAKELFPGQICADDGPGWEKLWIGSCPQGYNGLRKWAKDNGKFTSGKWPWCEPCKAGSICYEFKPGVGKCIIPASANTTNLNKANAPPKITYLKEGDMCLDFSGGKTKWKEPNPLLFAKTCEWPFFSCNLKANSVYICERIRDSKLKPVKRCYRAAGSVWWGGTDQAYYWNEKVNQFKPCGGPNTDYPRCPSWCTA